MKLLKTESKHQLRIDKIMETVFLHIQTKKVIVGNKEALVQGK